MIGGSIAPGYGDVASKRYAQHKVVVPNALVSRQFEIEKDAEYNLQITFYPTEEFMAAYNTWLPILVACSGAVLILLVSLVFVGYDVAVSGEAARKEIVLDTKRRFVRFVSHEIRTPMNAVRLGMTLFSTEIDGLGAKLVGKSLEEVHAILEETATDWRKIAVDVLDNSESAVDVLNDMLNYDKIESGSLRLEFSMVPVWKTLQRTFGTFVLQAREKDIVFQLQGEMFGADASLQLAGDLAHYFCVGDDTRIAQVLRNLISNSLKFTETRGRVTVRAEHLPNGLPSAVILQAPRILLAHARAGAVRITVVDDGAGLSRVQVGDICKEGVQFNVNTLQAGGGSGLGLFIGKGIVEQLGGTMLVSSEGLGIGATFVIELPLFRVEELDRSARLATPKSSEKGSDLGGIWGVGIGGKGGGEGIEEEEEEEEPFAPPQEPLTQYLLVVDDAVSNRKLLVRILKGRGYVCREAADGQQALDVYRQMCVESQHPCAVLMDFEMPGMNGPTATSHLREMGCDCYIIGVTGNVMQADVDVFTTAGADAVLAKPLRIEIFESMMASLVSSKSGPSSPAQRLASRKKLPPHLSPLPLLKVSPRSSKVYPDTNTYNLIKYAEDNAQNV
ncbi:histidine kinase-like ATPase [Ochromonadaceae sp. CCMP2298]|nr:histidine kinase-like ATPase [Ochromonadaceae sp. CCMP2298]